MRVEHRKTGPMGELRSLIESALSHTCTSTVQHCVSDCTMCNVVFNDIFHHIILMIGLRGTYIAPPYSLAGLKGGGGGVYYSLYALMLCQTTYSSSPHSSGANMQASIENIVILMAMSHKNPMYMYMLRDSMHWNIIVSYFC